MTGRPKKKVSAAQVEKLAAIQCTLIEIAAVLGCSKRTLQRNYRDAYERGKRKGRASVRREQYKLLQKGNATMAVWLGKQLLGQTDKAEHDFTSGGKPIEANQTQVVVFSNERFSDLYRQRTGRDRPCPAVAPANDN